MKIQSIASACLLLFVSHVAQASDFLGGSAADVWVIDNASGKTVGTYQVDGASRTEMATPLSPNDIQITLDNNNTNTISGMVLNDQSVLINKVEKSFPQQSAGFALPSVSVVGINAAFSSVGFPEKPGINMTPAGGEFAQTVEVKLHGIAARSNAATLILHWQITKYDLVSGALVSTDAERSVFPTDDPELGLVHSFYLFENYRYVIRAWSTQGNATTEKSDEQTFTFNLSNTSFKRDTDGDGIPDAFEIANGLNPLVNDINLDSDGDGWSDIDELLRGTDPTNPDDKPADTDGDGWSDFDETLRGTNPNDPAGFVEIGAADKPEAGRLYEVEYFISGSIYSDVAETSKLVNMGPLTVYDVNATKLYDSAELKPISQLFNELSPYYTNDTDRLIKAGSIVDRYQGDNARSSLLAGDYPVLRLRAGLPLILRAANDGDLGNDEPGPEWVGKVWIDSSPDLSAADVTAWHESIGGDWTTAEEWLIAYRLYLGAGLTADISTSNMSPQSGLGVALVEGVLSWHSDVQDSATILLGNSASSPSGIAAESVQHMLNDAGSSWNTLHSDLFSLTESGNELFELASAIVSYYDDLMQPVVNRNVNAPVTTTRGAAEIVQGAAANATDVYRLRLTSVSGLAAIDPADRVALMAPAIDFDNDTFINADELSPVYGLHTLPYEADSDGDYIPDNVDLCPADAENSCLSLGQQTVDSDGDGIIDSVDNCLNDANQTQTDSNNDGIGDDCRLYANIATPTTNMTLWLGGSVDFRSVVTEFGEGKSLQFDWDFAGGAPNQSVEDPGLVTFSSSGTFNIILTVTDVGTGVSLGSDTRTINVSGTGPSIEIGGPFAVVEGTAVSLSAVTTGYGETVSWDLDDGNVVSANAFSHLYAQDGLYNVIASAVDAFGNSSTDGSTVTVSDTAPTAAFSLSATQGVAPFAVSFTDLSVEAHDSIDSYLWDFDNGFSSTEQAPVHNFSEHGAFDTMLTVTDSDGSVDTAASQLVLVSTGFRLLADSDDDGVPDRWEIAFGTDPLFDDAALDADGDSFDNLTEFLTGNGPLSAADKPPGPAANSYILLQGGSSTYLGHALSYRWLAGLETPYANHVDGSPDGTLLASVLIKPAVGTETCSRSSLIHSGTLDSQHYLASQTVDSISTAAGRYCMALVADNNLDEAVEACLVGDGTAMQVELNIYQAGLKTSYSGIGSVPISTGFEWSLQKTADSYQLSTTLTGQSKIVQATAVVASPVETSIRPLFRKESCVTDSDNLAIVWTDFRIHADSDGDGLTDLAEDPNADGILDAGETSPTMADTDLDGLSDSEELALGTDPRLTDTDGDGFDDAEEVAAGTDPNDILDFPVIADGDVNNDGSVNVIDIMLVTRHVLNLGTLTPEQILRADVAPLSGGTPAPDGEVTTADLLVIQRKALGLINF